jgi:hypothetical protein
MLFMSLSFLLATVSRCFIDLSIYCFVASLICCDGQCRRFAKDGRPASRLASRPASRPASASAFDFSRKREKTRADLLGPRLFGLIRFVVFGLFGGFGRII